MERHVVDMQRVVSRRSSCKRQRRRDRHAHERTTVTSVENDTRVSITSCGRNDERSPSDRRGARGANDDRPERAPWSDTSSTCNEWRADAAHVRGNADATDTPMSERQ